MEKIERFKKHEPDGCLKWQNKGKKIYYYQQFKNESKNIWDRKYIKKDELFLAKELAKKQYYIDAKSVVETNLKELKSFLENYHPEELEKAYTILSNERKSLVEPLHDSKEERIRKWNEEEYEKTILYPENLKYETEQGELVRSKSEVIIANALYRCKDDILYKYERPLKVMVSGYEITIYPDFTVMNIHTGKITYWEHAGLLDEPAYANDFTKKINTYANNDLLIGRDVVITCETTDNPLDIKVIKKLVEKLRGEE